MENNEQTTPESENNILKSLEEKVSELTGLSMEDIQNKAGYLLEKVKSGDLMAEGKSMLNNLMSGDANDKIGDLTEEAKGLWDNFNGSRSTENK
jgi:hypothetical protein